MNPEAPNRPALEILPEVAAWLRPLFEVLPLPHAMPDLLPDRAAASDVCEAVALVLGTPVFAGRPHLAAGLWLYADELERSHRISQGLNDPLGAYWHAIMHRREGDFGNAKYWYRAAGTHPTLPDFDPFAFVDEVGERHHANPPDLLSLQREEWLALFNWCAARSA